MRPILTSQAPFPAGHYSQAIVCNGLVYVSGQLPLSPKTGAIVGGDIEDQARQVFRNLAAILEAADSNFAHVLKTTAYISDISLWSSVNTIYEEVFGDHQPARSIVPTRELHFDALIEIDAIALIEDEK